MYLLYSADYNSNPGRKIKKNVQMYLLFSADYNMNL